jgi:hypothetical protein
MDEYGTEKNFGRESQNSAYYGESSYHRDGLGRRVLESFKRDPNMNMTPKGAMGSDGKVFDVETAAQNTATSPLARRLKGRHLQMIAIGGSIGMFINFSPFVIDFASCSPLPRYWSIRRLRTGPCQRWAGESCDSLLLGRYNDVLHRPRSR